MANFPPNILFENENFIVVNKPSGLLSIPDRYDAEKANLRDILAEKFKELLVVHRIDKEISGLVILAKDTESQKELSQLFENQEIITIYACITEACPTPESGIIDLPIAHSAFETGKMMIHKKGKVSISYYKIIEAFRKFCFIEVSPKTGRTHQIRVHMAALSCPIVCDPLYGIRETISIKDIKSFAKIGDFEEEKHLLNRTALHASRLEFNFRNQVYKFDCPLPKELKALLNQLRKWQSVRKL